MCLQKKKITKTFNINVIKKYMVNIDVDSSDFQFCRVFFSISIFSFDPFEYGTKVTEKNVTKRRKKEEEKSLCQKEQD